MSDPIRWLDRDAPAGALELLRVAEPTRAVPDEVKARSVERVAGLALTAPSVKATAGVSWGLGAKLVGLAAVLLVAGALAWRAKASMANDNPPPVTRAPVAPRVVTAPAPHEELPREPLPVPPIEAPAPPRTVPASSPAPDNPLRRETNALARVTAALDRDPRAARRLLDVYRRAHPRGQLAEERDFLAFEIARRLQENDEASERASAFLHDYPRSPHGSDVRRWTRSP